METEILNIAKALHQQGKTPTVALVKAKLSKRVAMPVIIQALQYFNNLSCEQVQSLSNSKLTSQNNETPQEDDAVLQDMQKQIDRLSLQVQQLTAQVNQLLTQQGKPS